MMKEDIKSSVQGVNETDKKVEKGGSGRLSKGEEYEAQKDKSEERSSDCAR